MLSRHRVAKELDAVVCALHFGILTGNNFAHRCGEIFLVHRPFIFLDRGIFASLALCQDGVIIAFSDGGLKIDPGPMHRTRGTTAVLGFAFTQSYRLALQFTGKTGTLQRILVENRLKFRIFHCFRSLTETFLSVLQRFDEIVDCRDCFLLLSHTNVSYPICLLRSSFLARSAAARNFSYEQKRERLNKGTAAESENACRRLRYSRAHDR